MANKKRRKIKNLLMKLNGEDRNTLWQDRGKCVGRFAYGW